MSGTTVSINERLREEKERKTLLQRRDKWDT